MSHNFRYKPLQPAHNMFSIIYKKRLNGQIYDAQYNQLYRSFQRCRERAIFLMKVTAQPVSILYDDGQVATKLIPHYITYHQVSGDVLLKFDNFTEEYSLKSTDIF